MSQHPGQHGPITPKLCEHLLTGTDHQPLALLAFDRDITAYYCPACLAAEIELLIDHLPPGDISAAISFAKCDHMDGHCSTCEIATTAAIQQSWARAALTDRARANRLGRLLRLLGHRYGRERLQSVGADEAPIPLSVPYSPRMLRSQTLQGDRARAAREWAQGRAQRERTLRAPVRRVAVIPPRRESVPA